MRKYGGNILAPWGRMEQMLAQMSNFYDSYALSISGLSAPNIVAGSLDMNVWKPGEYIYQIHNAGTAEAVVIYKNGATSPENITIRLASGQFSGKLPGIRYIVQSGTSDSLVVFTQKYTA